MAQCKEDANADVEEHNPIHNNITVFFVTLYARMVRFWNVRVKHTFSNMLCQEIQNQMTEF